MDAASQCTNIFQLLSLLACDTFSPGERSALRIWHRSHLPSVHCRRRWRLSSRGALLSSVDGVCLVHRARISRGMLQTEHASRHRLQVRLRGCRDEPQSCACPPCEVWSLDAMRAGQLSSSHMFESTGVPSATVLVHDLISVRSVFTHAQPSRSCHRQLLVRVPVLVQLRVRPLGS